MNYHRHSSKLQCMRTACIRLCSNTYAGHGSKPTAVAMCRQGLRSVQAGLPKLPVRKYDFDWHSMLREMRDVGTVEAIWQKLESLLPESGLACGVMEDAGAGGALAWPQPEASKRATTGRCPVKGMVGQAVEQCHLGTRGLCWLAHGMPAQTP